MKYTIEGFSQQKVILFKNEKQKIDCTDLVLLRWFIDFKDTSKIEHIDVEDERYYWITYDKVLSDLPILSMSKRSVYERFQKLVNFGILTHYHCKTNGSFSYYGIGPMYETLISDDRGKTQEPCEENFRGGMKKTSDGVGSQVPSKDYSIIDSSIKDIYPHNPPKVDANKPKKKSRAEKKQDVEDVIHAYTQDEEVLDRLDAWLEVRKEKRAPNTIRAVKINLKKLDNMARLSKMSVPQYLDEIVARGWAAFYVINNFSKNNTNYKNNTNCNNSQKINDAPVTEHDIYGD